MKGTARTFRADAGNVQAESRSASLSGQSMIAAEETVENPPMILRWNSRPFIMNLKDNLLVFNLSTNRDPSSLRAEAQGIVDDIVETVRQGRPVSPHRRKPVRDFHMKGEASSCGVPAPAFEFLVQEVMDINQGRGCLGGVKARFTHDVVQVPAEPGGFMFQNAEHAPFFFALRHLTSGESFCEQSQIGNRCLELVRDIREEFAFCRQELAVGGEGFFFPEKAQDKNAQSEAEETKNHQAPPGQNLGRCCPVRHEAQARCSGAEDNALLVRHPCKGKDSAAARLVLV